MLASIGPGSKVSPAIFSIDVTIRPPSFAQMARYSSVAVRNWSVCGVKFTCSGFARCCANDTLANDSTRATVTSRIAARRERRRIGSWSVQGRLEADPTPTYVEATFRWPFALALCRQLVVADLQLRCAFIGRELRHAGLDDLVGRLPCRDPLLHV